jgi:hypothetical protein
MGGIPPWVRGGRPRVAPRLAVVGEAIAAPGGLAVNHRLERDGAFAAAQGARAPVEGLPEACIGASVFPLWAARETGSGPRAVAQHLALLVLVAPDVHIFAV